MVDRRQISEVARVALDHWSAGRLSEAAAIYRDALGPLPSGHWAKPYLRQQLAAVLAAQDFDTEARVQFELALEEELAVPRAESADPRILAARCFLGQHLVKMGDFIGAVTAVKPALGQPGDGPLRMVHADSLLGLGDRDGAIDVLEDAARSSEDADVRNALLARVAELRGDAGSQGAAPVGAARGVWRKFKLR